MINNKIISRRSFLLLLTLFLCFSSLTACGTKTASQSTVAETASQETTAIESELPADSNLNTTENEAAAATEEDFSEPIQYDGIDLDSTLPAYEWVASSFPGVMDPYKVVVYNDDTNYKAIIENGARVKFHKDDKVLIYQANTVDTMWMYDDIKDIVVTGFAQYEFVDSDETFFSDNYWQLDNECRYYDIMPSSPDEVYYRIDNFYRLSSQCLADIASFNDSEYWDDTEYSEEMESWDETEDWEDMEGWIEEDDWNPNEIEISLQVNEDGEESEFYATLVVVD